MFIYSLEEKKKTEAVLPSSGTAGNRTWAGNGPRPGLTGMGSVGYGSRSMASAYRMPRNAIQRKAPLKKGDAGKTLERESKKELFKKQDGETGKLMDNDAILRKMEAFLLELNKLKTDGQEQK